MSDDKQRVQVPQSSRYSQAAAPDKVFSKIMEFATHRLEHFINSNGLVFPGEEDEPTEYLKVGKL